MREVLGEGQEHRQPPTVAAAVMPQQADAQQADKKLAIEDKKPVSREDIAIVGLSGRYPQARNIGEFWQLLRSGRNAVTEIPRNRWDHRRYFDKDRSKPGATYTKWGGFLDGVDEFDPLFFNISPREAEMLDPRVRERHVTVVGRIEGASEDPDRAAHSHTSVSSPIYAMPALRPRCISAIRRSSAPS